MARVVVIGGGYGGITVAKGLDPIADVVLVEQRDLFVHTVATLRAVVSEAWGDMIFMPYDHLLQNGEVIQGTVNRVEGNTVHIFGREPIEADYVVFATGSRYPFPAKHSTNDLTQARSHITHVNENLQQAETALIIGAGTVGLELAGELMNAFPHLEVVIVEKENDILLKEPNITKNLRDLIWQQLQHLGVRVITGTTLLFNPPTAVGELGHFTVKTASDARLRADIWFQCHGSEVNSEYLQGTSYEQALERGGALRVQPTMGVVGFDRAYAVGDMTNVPEAKRAHAAHRQARVVIANIADQIAGEEPTQIYSPPKESVVIPLGPNLGASQLVDSAGKTRIIGAEPTSDIKGQDLLVPIIHSQLNLPPDFTADNA